MAVEWDRTSAQLAADGTPPGVEPASRFRGLAKSTRVEAAAIPLPPQTTLDDGSFERDALYGIVLDMWGAPLPNVAVVLLSAQPGRDREGRVPFERVAEAETDEGGRFRFRECSSAATYQVALTAVGQLPRLVAVSELGLDQEYVMKPALPIAGRVLDSRGNGIPSVAVILKRAHWDGTAVQHEFVAESNEAGEFELPWVGLAVQLKLLLQRPGGVPVERRFQVIEERRDGYDLVVMDGVDVTVRVVDGVTGVPVASAELRKGGRSLPSSGAPGVFALREVAPLSPQDKSLHLVATAEGYTDSVTRLSFADLSEGDEYEISVSPGAEFAGRVEDAKGRPISGASISVSNENKGTPSTRLGLTSRVRQSKSATAYSDAAGNFVVRGLLPGPKPLSAFVEADGYESQFVWGLLVSGPGDRVEREVQLPVAPLLVGQVTVDGVGRRLFVSWRCDGADGSVGSGTVTTNDAGEYRIQGLVPGDVALRAALRMGKVQEMFGLDSSVGAMRSSVPSGVGGVQERVYVAAGEVTRHDFDLDLDFDSIAGRVLDSSGAPVAGLRVRARGEGEAGELYAGEARTDDTGGFRIEVPVDSSVTYAIYGGRNQSGFKLRRIAPGTDNLLIELGSNAPLTLRVETRPEGESPTRMNVEWRPVGAPSFRAPKRLQGVSPDPSGAFVAQLPAGLIDLKVTDPSRRFAAGFSFGVHLAPEGGSARIELEPAVDLVLTFRGPGRGARRPPGSLVLVPEDLDPSVRPIAAHLWRDMRVKPNKDGRARVRGLAPGRYAVVHAANRLAFDPPVVEIERAGRKRVKVQWERLPE